ncbi:MAG: tRNA pseudouridine(55) synthase TruB [Nitrospinae bacterium]|nr:tRNA pseudouridine(55) synthase TruB [Nitrospinota bacterium]MBL7019726.1 tRNA pseudouridine(55) synthase TruB [Nitrospinaceae bacterium]
MDCTLNQVVNLYKPSGPTSFSMVQLVKKILGVKKAGHIGTLDPMAEGILPICLNLSTRIIQFLGPLSKRYQCTMVLGSATDTQDSTGKPIFEGDPSGVTEVQVRNLLISFTGEQKQVPPMYSAKKSNGIPLYKLARNGITIERKPVSVHFYSIDFVNMEGNRVEFEVHCSAGTYIRTLCHDIGQSLGCGAHMSGLIRKQVGVFTQDSSLTPEALETANNNGSLARLLFPVEKALEFLPEIRINDDFVEPIANGNALPKFSLKAYPEEFKPGMMMRVCNGSDKVLAIVEPLVDQEQFSQMAPKDIAFKLKRVLI